MNESWNESFKLSTLRRHWKLINRTFGATLELDHWSLLKTTPSRAIHNTKGWQWKRKGNTYNNAQRAKDKFVNVRLNNVYLIIVINKEKWRTEKIKLTIWMCRCPEYKPQKVKLCLAAPSAGISDSQASCIAKQLLQSSYEGQCQCWIFCFQANTTFLKISNIKYHLI